MSESMNSGGNNTNGIGAGSRNGALSVPRISIQAFCATDAVNQLLESAAVDRRLMRAHCKVHTGGIPAAAEFYQTTLTPNLLILENDAEVDVLMDRLGALAEVCDPSTKVILINHQRDEELKQNLLGLGISQVLDTKPDLLGLISEIAKLYENTPESSVGQVVSFLSAKGGSGSSTICHNVGWSIASKLETDALIVDLDVSFGTVGLNFNQSNMQGLADAILSADRMDPLFLERLQTKCADRLRLLLSPSSIDRQYSIEVGFLTQLNEMLRSMNSVVLYDLPHAWTQQTEEVLKISDEVVICMTPELSSLRNAKNIVDHLREIRPTDRAPLLVVNQVAMHKRPEIEIDEIIGALSMEPTAVITHNAALFCTAANGGQMISEISEKSATAETFVQLACHTTGLFKEFDGNSKASMPLLQRLGLKRAS